MAEGKAPSESDLFSFNFHCVDTESATSILFPVKAAVTSA